MARNRRLLETSIVVALATWVPACLTDPERPPPEAPEAELAPETPARPLAVVPALVNTCTGGTRPAADGLIDDLEDGNPQSAPFGGRTGYWWVAKADHATITTPMGAFVPSAGIAGTKWATHFAGKTDSRDQWGAAVGVSFLESGFYDASKYAGVAFRIKANERNLDVRVKLPDVSTHPDGGVCSTECWNSFGKDLVVGPDWQDVVIPWSDLAQQPNWGNPRPPGVTPSKLKNIEWAVNQGVEFDFVVDDVRFVECA